MRKLVASAFALTSMLVAGHAAAAFHLMNIVEVNVGTDSYVVLEMYADGQNVTSGHSIIVSDAADNILDTVTLTNVPKGDKNSRILIGTSTVEAKFGVKPDFATLKVMNPTGGKVCFDAIDCFSWGNYPSKAPAGAPFSIPTGKAAGRKVAGGATAKLDGTEDTNDSAADFQAVDPAPANNAGPAVDAGSTTSSSSGGTTTSSSSSSSSGGTTSSSSSGGTTSSSGTASSSSSGAGTTSGVTTNPSSSTGGATPSSSGATPASEEDSGCNTTGESTAFAFAPMLGLMLAAAMLRRRARS